jgi:hypothetical protein
MSWVLFLERPWVQSKHLLLVFTGIALAMALDGYSHALLGGSVCFLFSIFVLIPGHMRHEQVLGATKILNKAISEERPLSHDEVPILLRAIGDLWSAYGFKICGGIWWR